MKTPVLAAIAVVVGMVAPCLAAERLPRSSPESQGVSSAALIEFIDAADKTIESMNSFMLIRHGHVVAEGWWAPYSAEAPHSLYSLSKSFTSTAVGLAIAEGKLKTWLAENVLVEQPFVKDDSKTVGQLLQSAGLKMGRFARYKVGEVGV